MNYTPLEMFGYSPFEMFGYSLKGITCGLTRFGITGALTLLMPRTNSDVHRVGQHSSTALFRLTASFPTLSSRPTSTKGSTALPSRANQASQAQQPVAAHRDTGDAPRIRPSLPGRLEAASFSLHSVNFGLPWSSSAASSTSCSSENDAEASSPLDLQPRTIVLL